MYDSLDVFRCRTIALFGSIHINGVHLSSTSLRDALSVLKSAMPKTCNNWLGLVNSCVNYARQMTPTGRTRKKKPQWIIKRNNTGNFCQKWL